MGISNITVLLIEDNEDHAELISQAFQDSGDRFSLTNTTCLAEAKDWLSDHNPHIVIADIKLPDGSGMDLLTMPEDVTRFPIIVMTSYGSELIAVDSIKKGAIEYLRKSNDILQTMPHIVVQALEKWSHIVERRHAELALRESEERLQTIINVNNDAMIVINIDGLITLFNPAAEIIFGYRADEMLGHSINCLIPKSYRSQHSEDVARFFFKEKSDYYIGPPGELIALRANGEEFPIECSLAKGGSGDQMFVVGVIRDITRRKRVEEEIKIKNLELEAALKVQKELLSMVSHELRTPLVPIVGYSDLLLSETFGSLPEESVEPVRVIHDRAQDLVKIVEDLFIITDLERDNLKLRIEPLSISSNMREMIVEFESYTHSKEVSIEWAGKDFIVNADRTRLHQILGNLIDNAIKYSKDSVEIIIDSQIAGEMGYVFVKDNGIGISEQNLVHVFDRFYQAEEMDTREHGGSGLGLAITRELVELMGGAISVESEPGVGSTFSFSLPIAVKATC